jgi:hypothetical protein
MGIGLDNIPQCVKLDAIILIIADRNESKRDAAKADILKFNPASKTQVEVWILDKESIEMVTAFEKRFKGSPRLNFAILNVAVFKFDCSGIHIQHSSLAVLTV